MRFSTVCVSLLLSIAVFPGTSDRQDERTLTVPAGPGRPSFTLHVLTKEHQGIVEVSSPAGTRSQTLTCDLAPFTYFVRAFAIEDMDMDGHPDLRAPREFGAKFERYCIWLYQPSSRSFERDQLAEQMELLSNLQVDAAHHRLVSNYIGPVLPSWDVYRIVKGADPRQRLLIPEQTCVIESDASGIVAAIVTRYANGRAQTERHEIPGVQGTAQQICDGFGGTGR